MKQTIWSRILAFAVAMTMLLEILPMTSSAAADSFSSNTDTSSLAESMDNELSVVGEVSELRDATSKHFRLSDGSYAAVEYGIPIHFQTEDGAWTEIDNTLIYSQASYDTSSMLDYAIASKDTCSTYLQWDITSEVERWYAEDEDNRTIALVAYESGTFSTQKCAAVAFQGYQQKNLPIMVLTYRSAIGLENYYTYQAQSIGYAGNAFVGDYSGQLILSNTQAVNASTLMPFSLNLVYNSYYSDEKCAIPELEGTGMKFGAGWKLDAVQYLGDDENAENYKKYIDADGTYHYFRKAKGEDVWNDEDGLNLEIKPDNIYDASKSSYVTGYSIINDKGAKLSFYNGLLVQQVDHNGNIIRYLYNDADDDSELMWLPRPDYPNQITKIIQRNVKENTNENANENVNKTNYLTLATLRYTDGDFLQTITDRANNTCTYTIGDVLTEIEYSSGHKAVYTYYDDGKLQTAQDESGRYQITYTYGPDGRVSGYFESAKKDDNWENGLAVSVSGNKEKTIYTACGPDAVLYTNDDILTTYLFDDAGRTCNVYSTNVDSSKIYGASVGTYNATNETSAKNNHIASSATVGASASNWLRNAGFESPKTSGGNDANYWSFTGAKTSDSSPTNIIVNGDNHRTGVRGLKMWIASDSTQSVSASQTITGLEIGEEYTFSVYINTSNALSFNASGVYLSANNGSTIAEGTPVNYKTSSEIENGWTRINVTFVAGSSNTISIVANGVSGITYADDAQLEGGDVPSNANLVNDGGMEYGGFWSGVNYEIATAQAISGSKVAKVTSTPLTDGYLVQTVPINYSGANTFVLSAWAKADALADNLNEDLFGERKNFGLKAIINYSDGTEDEQEFYAPFNAEIRNEWQYGNLIIVPTKPTKTIESIEVYCQYTYNNGVALFDDISLIREAAQTMKYDDEGNLQSVATPGVEEDTSTYENGDLTQVVTSSSGTFTYEYDNHNLKSATNGIITQTYDYSNEGNNISTVLSGMADENGVIEQMKTSATYGENRNLIESVTNAQHSTTDYDYVTDISRMYGTPNMTVLPAADEESTRTTYVTSYANDGRVELQYINGMVSTHYTYEDDNLTQIIRGGYLPSELGDATKKNQTYNLEYNAFDQVTSVSVGTKKLSENTYDDVGNLIEQEYGNDHSVSYTYDYLNRVKTESRGPGKDVEYFYSAEGYLSRIVDKDTGEEYNYIYDSLSRLVGSAHLDANGNVIQRTEHQYDDANRLSKQTWMFDDKTYTETYVYNQDGTLKRVQNSNPTNYWFEYDSLSRVSTQSNYYFKQGYNYLVKETADGDFATPLVSKLSFGDTNDYTQFADFYLEYKYDALGNIKKIIDSRSGTTTTYTYDAQGQLLKEDRDGEVYAYSYDTYGNIRSRTDPDGTEHVYEYGDSQWLDLLTKYDGYTIAYDEIGNPTSYNTGNDWWSLQWSNGRQLTTAITDSKTITYTYDINGIRNSKTSNGVTYNYITQNGKVVRQTWTEGKTDYVLDIIYDVNGRPYSCYYQGKHYLYVCNLQGDVIRIVSAYNSTTFVEYTYDAWGNILSVDGSMADSLGKHNPIRYRGYYYDTDTGFYYLQSRYYDPSIGRFINADSFASTGQGFLGGNMYTYCLNNPIIHADSCGTDACIVIDDDGAIGFGHIGFLVEDDEGQWWHFYWGPQNGLIPIIGIDVKTDSWCEEYDGGISLEAINASGQYGEAYDRMIYLIGNFSDCIDVAKSLNSKYNLYNNNCSQVSLGTLSKANTPYRDQLEHAATFCIIPKCAFRYLENTCKMITPRGNRGRDMFTVLD